MARLRITISISQNGTTSFALKGKSMTQEKAEVILDKIEKMLLKTNLDVLDLLTLYARIANIVNGEVDK